jgi:ribose transport system substrate-binding protein
MSIRGLRSSRTAVAVAVAAALVGCVLLAGCGSSSSSDGSSTESGSTTAGAGGGGEAALESIAFANATEADPQLKSVGDILEGMAKEEGVEFSRYDNKFEPEASLQNARLIAQAKPQIAVDWSAVAEANESIGAQFENADLSCIAMSVEIPSCSLINQDNAKLGAELGEYAAEQAKQRGWEPEETTLVIVNAPFIGPELNKLPQNFYSGYAKQFPEMPQMTPDEITSTTTSIGEDNAVIVDGKGELQPTNEVVRTALTTIPSDRHLVVAALINDDSALGALRALEQANRDGDAMVVAAGADQNGLENLRKNPDWIAEGSTFFELWPEYVMAMAKAQVAGTEMPELTPAPQAVLTKQNVDKYYDANGGVKAGPPIPSGASYLKEYGLR